MSTILHSIDLDKSLIKEWRIIEGSGIGAGEFRGGLATNSLIENRVDVVLTSETIKQALHLLIESRL